MNEAVSNEAVTQVKPIKPKKPKKSNKATKTCTSENPKTPIGRTILDWLGILPDNPHKAPSTSELQKLYTRPPSFLKFMPYRRYDPESECFFFATMSPPVRCLRSGPSMRNRVRKK